MPQAAEGVKLSGVPFRNKDCKRIELWRSRKKICAFGAEGASGIKYLKPSISQAKGRSLHITLSDLIYSADGMGIRFLFSEGRIFASFIFYNLNKSRGKENEYR